MIFVEVKSINEKALCNGVEKKVLVVDCRSYSVAFANRVKGGGSECTGIVYYVLLKFYRLFIKT